MNNPNPSGGTPSSRELIFRFLVDYKEAHQGETPSTREIADGCCLSPSSVKYHLTQLEIDNRIEVLRRRPRQIRVVGGTWIPPQRQLASEHWPAPGQDEQDNSLDQDHRQRPSEAPHSR